MKLWQLFSISREEPSVIGDEASREPRWHGYQEAWRDQEALIKQQRRDVLDSFVDEEFSEAVTRRLKRKLYLSGETLCSRRRGLLDRELSIHDAVRKFGGEAVEDAFEYGSVGIGSEQKD